MKKLLTLICTLSVSTLFAQNTHIAHYNIKYLFETNPSGNVARFGSYLSNAQNYEEDVELTLTFNKERSFFEMDEGNKNSENKWAFSLSGCEKPVYMNAVNKTIKYYNQGVIPMGIFEDTYLLVNDLFSDWKLTDEQKNINGYIVYKATKIQKDVQENETLVTAWYAPEFPFPFGPLKYGGLPGLIVQLQEKDKMFTLSKFEFDKNKEIPKEPTDGKIMTEEAYKKMEYETYLNMRKK